LTAHSPHRSERRRVKDSEYMIGETMDMIDCQVIDDASERLPLNGR
jgi:hypothetical protein